MTIEKAIKHGKDQLEIFGGEHREFIECALDTMEKYQAIKRIISARNNMDISNLVVYCRIKEVVEDG